MTQVGHIESRVSDMLLTPVQDALPGIDVADRAAALNRVPDDKAMLRAVTELTRDLGTPNPRIFWSDFLASAFLGYAGLFVAIISGNIWLQCAAALVAVLALYRAGGFIHEVTHVKHSALPGFRLGFNAVIGYWCRLICMKASIISTMHAHVTAPIRILNICRLP